MGERCPVCGATSIYFDPARGEYYCPVCGYVYGYEEVPAHHDQIQAKRDYENMVIENTDTRNKQESSANREGYDYAIAEIRRIAANLKLPSYVVKEVERRYNYLVKNKYMGHNYNTIEALIPALILLAAYEYDYNLSFEDVYKLAKEEPDNIKSAFFRLFTLFSSMTAKTYTIEGDG